MLADCLISYEEKGPQCLQAWLSEYWWLTALPQQCNRFRESQLEKQLYLVWQDGVAKFYERNQEAKFVCREGIYNIKKEQLNDHMQQYLWLDRSYKIALYQYLETKELRIKMLSR